ncbi:MAG: hypothetical protein KAI17_28075, partial [Thiotrichaceae bacterium]|nr:hypothetical protein [Thiotrichaceae bacterium]
KVVKRGKLNEGTWLQKYLYLKYAMWLSIEFEVDMMIWMTDNLLELRNQSGDEYRVLCESAHNAKIAYEPWDYSKIAMAIAMRVLGTSQTGCWNDATIKQLDLRKEIEVAMAYVIDAGFVTSLAQAVSLVQTHKAKK